MATTAIMTHDYCIVYNKKQNAQSSEQSKPSLVEDISLSLETHSITCTTMKADMDIQNHILI